MRDLLQSTKLRWCGFRKDARSRFASNARDLRIGGSTRSLSATKQASSAACSSPYGSAHVAPSSSSTVSSECSGGDAETWEREGGGAERPEGGRGTLSTGRTGSIAEEPGQEQQRTSTPATHPRGQRPRRRDDRNGTGGVDGDSCSVVVKASLVLSEQRSVESVAKSLLELTMTNVGAQRAVLVIKGSMRDEWAGLEHGHASSYASSARGGEDDGGASEPGDDDGGVRGDGGEPGDGAMGASSNPRSEANHAPGLVPPDDAHVWVVGEAADGVVSVQTMKYECPLRSFEDVCHGVVTECLQGQRAIVSGNTEEDARLALDQYVRRCKPRSIMCVPLRRGDRFLGCVYMENYAMANAFRAAHVEMAGSVATYAAIALENVRLLEELRGSKQRLEHTIQALGHAAAAKQEMLLVASHELRTPLVGIQGIAESLMERPDMNEEVRRQLDVVLSSASRLNELVSTMLMVGSNRARDGAATGGSGGRGPSRSSSGSVLTQLGANGVGLSVSQSVSNSSNLDSVESTLFTPPTRRALSSGHSGALGDASNGPKGDVEPTAFAAAPFLSVLERAEGVLSSVASKASLSLRCEKVLPSRSLKTERALSLRAAAANAGLSDFLVVKMSSSKLERLLYNLVGKLWTVAVGTPSSSFVGMCF